ncbi:hypothetical protein [Agrobacterium larrymoorei]|uniref:Molecular chaperone DnaJ n=1 Tax=Agrobacterium larrymoorei TaxID=160699 RepID=A0ABU0UP49_9HYPH|nr:hypothetical protein [Agrobacterium larrymoorei]MDQ1186735.1 hypothetical protein [Agrobacterium larrymoorei]
MLFGQSVFQSVVARLEREADERPEEETQTSFSPRVIFDPGPITTSSATDTKPDNRPLSAYLDLLEETTALNEAPKVEEREPAPMPNYLEKTSLAEVSDELAINNKDTLDSLSEKRRAFARLNHPDAVPHACRENAHLRMTAANLLIDQAIRLLPLMSGTEKRTP